MRAGQGGRRGEEIEQGEVNGGVLVVAEACVFHGDKGTAVEGPHR